MVDLRRPIEELAAEVRGGNITARELAQASLDAIGRHQDYHAILETNAAALKRADEVDAQVKRGEGGGRWAWCVGCRTTT